MATQATDNTIVGDIGFDLLGESLGQDVDAALKSALCAGAQFPGGADPILIFRNTLQSSIRDIETHKRGQLFQRFLRDGPYEGQGAIPRELTGKRLTDMETAEAITFIYSFMVNNFKGAVTELLAAGACQRLLKDPCVAGVLPSTARLYVGDAVMVHRRSGTGLLKGADLHILISANTSITVAGVAEVKSGRKSADAMIRQLDRHLTRAQQGLLVAETDYRSGSVRIGHGPNRRVLRITVQPSDWKLPRTFRFEDTGHSRLLHVDSGVPPHACDNITDLGADRWHIALKWSIEAIAQAAYEMTFWYMEKVGEFIYSIPDALPKEWAEMSPADAGRNAIKMMLYYAILRLPTGSRAEQRAIALYNTYGFGYALGMNFRNKKGRREMLWPKDLDEIATDGCNKNGCRVV